MIGASPELCAPTAHLETQAALTIIVFISVHDRCVGAWRFGAAFSGAMSLRMFAAALVLISPVPQTFDVNAFFSNAGRFAAVFGGHFTEGVI